MMETGNTSPSGEAFVKVHRAICKNAYGGLSQCISSLHVNTFPGHSRFPLDTAPRLLTEGAYDED